MLWQDSNWLTDGASIQLQSCPCLAKKEKTMYKADITAFWSKLVLPRSNCTRKSSIYCFFIYKNMKQRSSDLSISFPPRICLPYGRLWGKKELLKYGHVCATSWLSDLLNQKCFWGDQCKQENCFHHDVVSKGMMDTGKQQKEDSLHHILTFKIVPSISWEFFSQNVMMSFGMRTIIWIVIFSHPMDRIHSCSWFWSTRNCSFIILVWKAHVTREGRKYKWSLKPRGSFSFNHHGACIL